MSAVDPKKNNLLYFREHLSKHKVQPTWAEQMQAGVVQPTQQQSRAIIPGGLSFIAIGDIQETEPDFLIDGLIETDCFASVFGDPGHGKSFFAIDLALCVATGTDFHGRDVQAGSVFYIAGEGHNGLGRRTKSWAKHHDMSLEDVPLFASTKAANFLDPAHAEFVAKQIDGLASLHGEPRLIVIDTLARNFGDGDENSTADMNAFVAAMDDMRTRYPSCTVLVVHHTGHGDKSRARGAMAFKGALDAEYQVAKADNVVTVTCKKIKEGAEPAPLSFKLEGITLGIDRKGEPYGSAVLVPCDTPAKKGAGGLPRNQKIAIETLREAAQSDLQEGSVHRGVVLSQWRKAYYQRHTGSTDNSKKSAFDRARAELADRGLIIVDNDRYMLSAGIEI